MEIEHYPCDCELLHRQNVLSPQTTFGNEPANLARASDVNQIYQRVSHMGLHQHMQCPHRESAEKSIKYTPHATPENKWQTGSQSFLRRLKKAIATAYVRCADGRKKLKPPPAIRIFVVISHMELLEIRVVPDVSYERKIKRNILLPASSIRFRAHVVLL